MMPIDQVSNTRVVEWSDGSKTLMVGNEVLKIAAVKRAEGEHVYAFDHRTENFYVGHGTLGNLWSFTPISLSSETHKRIAMKHKGNLFSKAKVCDVQRVHMKIKATDTEIAVETCTHTHVRTCMYMYPSPSRLNLTLQWSTLKSCVRRKKRRWRREKGKKGSGKERGRKSRATAAVAVAVIDRAKITREGRWMRDIWKKMTGRIVCITGAALVCSPVLLMGRLAVRKREKKSWIWVVSSFFKEQKALMLEASFVSEFSFPLLPLV